MNAIMCVSALSWPKTKHGGGLLSSATLERVAILGLYGGRNSPADRYRIDSRALTEALQHGHLRHEHVAFLYGGNGALGLMVHALGGIGNEHTGGVDDQRGGSLSFAGSSFLSAKQARL